MSDEPASGDAMVLEHETVDRLANVFVTAVPAALLGVAIWLAWGGALHWQDLVVLAVSYVITGFGVTVGYHRLFTHRSFKTTRALRALFAAFGSAAVEGPVIEWVSTHRKHHRFSDLPGDPHSPHTDHGVGWRGALRGLLHAHIGWMFRGVDRASEQRYAKDLLADPLIRAIDRTFPFWVLLGLAFPFGLGVAITGSIVGGLTGMLWGGAVRIVFLHHATFSINSLCHFFGRRRFSTGDESRNLAWLALPTFGEAQQPPRLPYIRASRPHSLAAGPRRLADRRPRADRARVGHRAHRTEHPASEARSPTVKDDPRPLTHRTCAPEISESEGRNALSCECIR